MEELYEYRRIRLEPRSWNAAAEGMLGSGAQRVEEAGGVFFGLWQGQIGMGRRSQLDQRVSSRQGPPSA